MSEIPELKNIYYSSNEENRLLLVFDFDSKIRIDNCGGDRIALEVMHNPPKGLQPCIRVYTLHDDYPQAQRVKTFEHNKDRKVIRWIARNVRPTKKAVKIK